MGGKKPNITCSDTFANCCICTFKSGYRCEDAKMPIVRRLDPYNQVCKPVDSSFEKTNSQSL